MRRISGVPFVGKTLTLTGSLTSEDALSVVVRAGEASARAQVAILRSNELVLESRRLRGDRLPIGTPRFFVVHGEVEGRPVRASWFRRSLSASPDLMARAEILVKLGEQFLAEETGKVVRASLTEALPSMLTLIRACDAVRDLVFGPFGPRQPEVRRLGK